MSPSKERHLLAVSVAAENLSCGDRKKVIYLCGSPVTDSSVDRVREKLGVKVDNDGDPPLFLMSVLWQIGRYDILRSVFKMGRNEIEQQIHKYGQVLPRFRTLMVTLSDDLEMEDVEQIKFLLRGTLSREKIENSKTFLDVVIELEKLDLVSPERVDVVEQYLGHVGRLDLLKKVTAYKMSVQTSDKQLAQQQSSRAVESRQVQPFHTAMASERHSPPPLNCRAALNKAPPNTLVQLEQYNLTANPRGLCVIIDCVGKDEGMLANLFKALHFNVLLHPMLSANEMFTTLKEISKQRESHGGDAFVCCIISRGTTNNLLGTDSNGRGLSMDKVRSLFVADACPVLTGKPKLFFIQGYSVSEFNCLARREFQEGEVEPDGCLGQPMVNYIPKDADIFWSQCWTDERQLQEEQHHSVYLKALTDSLSKGQRKMNLLDAHLKVNGVIHDHNKRHPEANYSCEIKYTLRKNLYLS